MEVGGDRKKTGSPSSGATCLSAIATTTYEKESKLIWHSDSLGQRKALEYILGKEKRKFHEGNFGSEVSSEGMRKGSRRYKKTTEED